jgi:excisionase family DNA binding protein
MDGLAGTSGRQAVETAEYLTVREVANKLRLSQFTIRRMIWTGKLKAKLFATRLRISGRELARFEQAETWTPQLAQSRTARPRAPRRKTKRVSPASPRPRPVARAEADAR